MASDVYFLHQIKHTKTGTWDKGIVIKDAENTNNFEAVKQSYHAYLGAYAYNHDVNTDYVACYITDSTGRRILWEVWDGTIIAQTET